MVLGDGAIWNSLVHSIYDGLDQDGQFPSARPLLAHYTSLDVLEEILKNEEIWFSNPLFMNDLDEVQFGIIHGAARAQNNDDIRTALGSEGRHSVFSKALEHYISQFVDKYLLDTYVFCMSEHDPRNRDGMLSMWRGYGGNGRGAALVFDMTKVSPVETSPVKIARVTYGSIQERFEWLDKRMLNFAKRVAEENIPDNKIYFAGAAMFQLLKIFALTSKHDGFQEEREWRFIYLSEDDDDERLKSMQHYLNGPRGVEPKLKFKLKPMEGVTPADLSLGNVVASILLGPSTSSALAVRSVERMLDLIGKPELKNRLLASSIPLRPI